MFQNSSDEVLRSEDISRGADQAGSASHLYPFEREELQSYGREAQRYDASRFDCGPGQVYHRRELDFLLTHVVVPPRSRVLDLAAGTARMAIPLARRGQSVVALDLSHEMLAAGRKKAFGEGVQHIQFVRGNGRCLPFPDEAFDLVMAIRFFHLIPKGYHHLYLTEVERVLKPGGLFVAEFLQSSYGLGLSYLLEFRRVYWYRQRPVTYLSPRQIHQLFHRLAVLRESGVLYPGAATLARLSQGIASALERGFDHFPLRSLALHRLVLSRKPAVTHG